MQRWARSDIEAYVRDRLVIVCDEHTTTKTMPDWIRDAAACEFDRSLAEFLGCMHPEDRGPLAMWFYDVLARPGEASTSEARGDLGDGWRRYEFGLLNLLEDPDVGGIIGVALPGEPVVVEDGALADPNAGDHERVDWILGRLDPDGRIVEIEGSVEALFGRTKDEVIGRPPVSFIHADSIPDIVALWDELTTTPGSTSSSRRIFVHPDGTELWAETTYLNRLADHGDILMLAYDISDRREQEEALRRSNEENRALAEQFRVLADEVPAAVFRCDTAGAVSFANARWRDLVERAGPVGHLIEAVHPDDRDDVERALAGLGEDSEAQRTTLELRSADDERVLALTLRWAADTATDSVGASVVGSIEDITDTVLLRHQAARDPLTGSWNRAAIEGALVEAVATGEGLDEAAVIFVDLDRFKTVNDTFGHEAGDAVLRAVADRLHRCLRPEDHVGRYGGDEFLVVCRGVDDAALTGLVGRIEEALVAPVPLHGGSWVPAASIGSVRPRPGEDAASAVRRADLAMFDDKRRNRETGAGAAAIPGGTQAAR